MRGLRLHACLLYTSHKTGHDDEGGPSLRFARMGRGLRALIVCSSFSAILVVFQMAPPRMSQSLTVAHRPGLRNPGRLIQAVSGLLILILLAADLTVLLRLREDALLDAESHMSAIALTLAEQADRAIQGMDLVLDGVTRLAATMEVVDPASFDRNLSSQSVHDTLLSLIHI